MLNIGIQTSRLINEKSFDQGYKTISLSGMKSIDYNIIQEEEYTNLDYEIYKSHLISAKNHGLYFSQVHEPIKFSNHNLIDDYDFLINSAKHSIKITEILEAKYLVVHPYQIYYGVNKYEYRELNIKYFKEIGLYAAKHNVVICIENKPDNTEFGIAKGICSISQDLVATIEELNKFMKEERFAACFDVGHANLLRVDIKEEILTLGKYLKVVHLHDNNTGGDMHQIPYTFHGSLNWKLLLHGLREINYRGTLSFETHGSIRVLPPSLHLPVLTLLKSIGDLFNEIIFYDNTLDKNKDKSIILFGAGEMADTYIDEYGDKYPPSFIVDNNQDLWGTEKRGIPIKAPESIKDTNNYKLILCSRYYEENILQLENIKIYDFILFEEILYTVNKL